MRHEPEPRVSLPVSAKAAKGSSSFSLLSDSSNMATRALICSTWARRWLDWQMDFKIKPICLQLFDLVQSCETNETNRNVMTDLTTRC